MIAPKVSCTDDDMQDDVQHGYARLQEEKNRGAPLLKQENIVTGTIRFIAFQPLKNLKPMFYFSCGNTVSGWKEVNNVRVCSSIYSIGALAYSDRGKCKWKPIPNRSCKYVIAGNSYILRVTH